MKCAGRVEIEGMLTLRCGIEEEFHLSSHETTPTVHAGMDPAGEVSMARVEGTYTWPGSFVAPRGATA